MRLSLPWPFNNVGCARFFCYLLVSTLPHAITSYKIADAFDQRLTIVVRRAHWRCFYFWSMPRIKSTYIQNIRCKMHNGIPSIATKFHSLPFKNELRTQVEFNICTNVCMKLITFVWMPVIEHSRNWKFAWTSYNWISARVAQSMNVWKSWSYFN